MSALANAHDWPEELDALHAAPGYHALLFENDSVRVLETHVPSRQTVPLHTHRWPAVLYILSWKRLCARATVSDRSWPIAGWRAGPAGKKRFGPVRCRRTRLKTSANQS
jgi:hypothetical protein